MDSFLNFLRIVHGWLGVIVVPWVLVMGLTGLYMNHPGFILSIFQPDEVSEARLETLRPPAAITRDSAEKLAQSIWPGQPIRKIWQEQYHRRPSFIVQTGRGRLILSIPTGHHYIKTRYFRRTYVPGEGLVPSKLYWGSVFSDLHETGWLGGRFGTWLADLFCLALLLFGVTGLLMWSIPRIRGLMRV